LGARLSRSTIQVVLQGNGAQADILGVVPGAGRQHADFQTLQDHVGSATRSDLFINTALDDQSSTNFTGLIRINPSARQTESSQQQRNVLLSPKAKADSDPKLEILNNDVVRCTHGASVGPLDPEILFYLQSRGLPHNEALDLLLEGFFQSVVEKLEMPSLQIKVWDAVQRKLRSQEG
jgi:Fe-S cluster assembly protein SufD